MNAKLFTSNFLTSLAATFAFKLILCLVIVSSMFHEAKCFEGSEHQELSRTAAGVALEVMSDYIKTIPAGSFGAESIDSEVVRKMLEARVVANRDRVIYADLVEAADYHDSPEFTLANYSNGIALATLNTNFLKEIRCSTLSKAAALHTNERHFQGLAVRTFLFYHQIAVELASSGSIMAALAFNAFADHFMQDIFAPGHMLTHRQSLDDAFSLASHDSCNSEGLDLQLNLDAQVYNVKFGDKNVDLLLRVAKEYGLRSDFSKIQTIHFKGDGKLSESVGQKVLISALTACSILDVLQSHFEGASVNRLKGFKFIYEPREYFVDGGKKQTMEYMEFKSPLGVFVVDPGAQAFASPASVLTAFAADFRRVSRNVFFGREILPYITYVNRRSLGSHGLSSSTPAVGLSCNLNTMGSPIASSSEHDYPIKNHYISSSIYFARCEEEFASSELPVDQYLLGINFSLKQLGLAVSSYMSIVEVEGEDPNTGYAGLISCESGFISAGAGFERNATFYKKGEFFDSNSAIVMQLSFKIPLHRVPHCYKWFSGLLKKNPDCL